MFQYTHRHGNRQWSFIISYCWGGVGWDNNVHVPVYTQAREEAVVFHHQLLLGWGGAGRGGVGWDNNVHVPVHTPACGKTVLIWAAASDPFQEIALAVSR